LKNLILGKFTRLWAWQSKVEVGLLGIKVPTYNKKGAFRKRNCIKERQYLSGMYLGRNVPSKGAVPIFGRNLFPPAPSETTPPSLYKFQLY
jgi:hypothetical protein